MSNVQPQFEDFHDEIKIRRFGRNKTLREKRDIIRDKIRELLPGIFESHDEETPDFKMVDQGSYAMGTGIKPLDGEYDIDQGIYFDVSRSDYGPVELKERVYEAVEGHTDDVKIRRPCVTIWYHRSGEPTYHVDLAVYADGDWGDSYLAKGRENSSDEYRVWERSDPPGLIEEIKRRFEGTDRSQFRRVVRYLKRWKDENFPADGNAAPISVGLTVAAYRWMRCRYADVASGDPDDAAALRGLVKSMLGNYGLLSGRLKVTLPVAPYNDLFEEMTDKHQQDFKEHLEGLQAALEEAQSSVDPHDAAEALSEVFGEDFPVPPKEETAEKQQKPYASSSSAA